MRVYFLLFYIFCVSCLHNPVSIKAKIEELLNSGDKDKIIKGFYLIGETKDSTFLKSIFITPDDPRVSNDLRYAGISIYQAKMIAIKKITNVNPPRQISNKPDTAIINFYFKIVKERQMLP